MATVDLATARTVIDAGIDAAAAIGVPCAIVVTDPGGHIVAAARMDGAAFIALDAARGKAVMGAAFHLPSRAVLAALEGDTAALAALHAMPQLTALPGGFPVLQGGATSGGMGVSGGHHSQDHEVGLAALRAVGLAGEGEAWD